MRQFLDRLILLLRTVVWLKPVQIYSRVWMRLYRPNPRRIDGAVVSLSPDCWQAIPRKSSMTGPDRFTFLNRTETLGRAEDWNAGHLPKLWLYNAHYFDDLVASGAAERSDWHRKLILRWIAENPAGVGNGWEPYPTSLRIVNWTKWLLSANPAVDGMLQSLATQADWLSSRLEYHLLGNHLFANAKALVFAGCVLDGPDAARWLKTGLRLLNREMKEQILPDGGHFERSVMYHAILTEDVLDLVQIGAMYPSKIPQSTATGWRSQASGMLNYLDAMTHPDGRIAFFNDGAFGIAPEPAALSRHAQCLGIDVQTDAKAIRPFDQTGYTRLVCGQAVLLTDTAPIGPGYLPGHAHADTLSFEFSLGGQRIFVNGGTSVYGGDVRQRHRERSTANHNTLCLDGQNSSEIWSDFRVARRAKASHVRYGETEGSVWIEGQHDGYRRIGGPVHKRRWELTETSLTVHDQLDHTGHGAKAYFRIHPDLQATPDGITSPRTLQIRATGGTLSIEDGTWSPEFGKVLPCKMLVLSLSDLASSVTFTWEP